MNKEEWDKMSNEELCIEYQKQPSNELFEYFLNRNITLIYSFMNKYLIKFPESEREDILQHCKIEMWNAMNTYVTDFNTNFTTYYYYYALKGLSQYLRTANVSGIQLPAYLLTKKNREKYADVIEMSHVSSLNNVVLSDDFTTTELIDFVNNPDDVNIDEYIESIENKAGLSKALEILKPKEKSIVQYYFGFNGNERLTLSEIGKKYGVTRECIRQTLTRAVRKLRKHIHEYVDVPKCTLSKNNRVYLINDAVRRNNKTKQPEASNVKD